MCARYARTPIGAAAASLRAFDTSIVAGDGVEPRPTIIAPIEQPLVRYATFVRRFRALLFDTAIVAGVLIAVMILGDLVVEVPGSGRIAWLVTFAVLFLYEPLFVWRRGATIGHAKNHLAVVAERTSGNPSFGQALSRYLIKLVLGLPSFVTMLVSRKHQAVHDWLTGTTVRLAADADPSVDDFHLEWLVDPTTSLPSRRRRVVATLAYLAVLFVAYAIALVAIDPERCLAANNCTSRLQLEAEVVTLVWLGASLLTIVAAWRGWLMGARRKRHLAIDAPAG